MRSSKGAVIRDGSSGNIDTINIIVALMQLMQYW